MKHEIEVTLTLGEEPVFEVHGVVGSMCETLSSWIDELGEVLEHKRTTEALGKGLVLTSKKIGISK